MLQQRPASTRTIATLGARKDHRTPHPVQGWRFLKGGCQRLRQAERSLGHSAAAVDVFQDQGTKRPWDQAALIPLGTLVPGSPHLGTPASNIAYRLWR